VSRYQKGKTNLDCTEARDSEWQWHLLGHMQVCISLQTDNHASTPPHRFLQAGCPSCRPTNSIKALKCLKCTKMSGGRALPGPAGGAYALPQKPKLGQPLASTTKYLVYICILASDTTANCPLYSTAAQCALAHLQLSNYAATGAHGIFSRGGP